MADQSSQQPAASSQQPAASEDVLDAIDREALARRVWNLLRQELRIQRERLGHRGE